MATITQALKNYEAALCRGTASEAEKLMDAVNAVIARRFERDLPSTERSQTLDLGNVDPVLHREALAHY